MRIDTRTDGTLAVAALGTLGFGLDGRVVTEGSIDPRTGGEIALGAARRMLDEWSKFAREKDRGPGMKLRDMQTFQRDYAQAYTDLAAADCWMKQVYTRLYDAAEAGTVPPQMQLDAKISASHAYLVAMRIANQAYAASTTTGLRKGCAIQRFFRDITGDSPGVARSTRSDDPLSR